jgi:sec-independent protein translocase protein TatA
MLDGWEWIIIGVVAIVIIMWGPSKIPEFAKALGRAKGEFSSASKEFEKAASLETDKTSTRPTAPPQAKNVKSKDEILVETARTMGIETEGKTQQQLSEEISVKAKGLSA